MGLTEILAQRGCYKENYFCVGEISRESGYRLTRELLETDDVPEVLVLGNDEVAEGALEAVKELKYRIPKVDTLSLLCGGTAHHAVYLIALLQKKLCQIASVLSGYTCNQCFFYYCHYY